MVQVWRPCAVIVRVISAHLAKLLCLWTVALTVASFTVLDRVRMNSNQPTFGLTGFDGVTCHRVSNTQLDLKAFHAEAKLP